MTKDGIGAFADHVIDTDYQALPPSAVRAVKTFILDGFGVGVAGSAGPWLDGLIASAKLQGSADDARVWVFGDRLPASAAAMINAYQMHNSEFDCVHEGAVVHAMTVPLAAAIAEAERKGDVDGRALITAAILGVDVAAHIGVASNAKLRFFRPATAGAFGAVAALGKLRAFDRATLINAFGIALAQLSGTMQAHVDGGVMLAMQMGFNARNAMVAADMAERGLAAPASVLEGEFGFFPLFEGDYDLAPSLDALGKTWRIEEIAHKPFPSGRATHGVLDGLLTLQREHGFNADAVERVTCRVPPLTAQLVGRPIQDVMEANYARLSAPYVLASALISDGVSIEDFSPKALSDQKRLALGRRIAVEVDDNPDKNALTPVTVAVALKDQATHEITMDVVYGNPKKPMTRDAHLEKFRRNWALAARPLPADHAEKLILLVDDLEAVTNVGHLVDLIAAPSS
ncbi:MAG: MmgE/PrpD family protein [Alphaproteobacteria bacterium]|nr:MmgE/PrpD family protein [Alphaproteobacteria bacterium]